MKGFLESLREKVLICDGATGTMLYERGISPQYCYEYLNIEQPQIVEDLHRSYLDAGADIIETNTFAANSSQLAKFNYGKLVPAINEAAAKIARKAAGQRAYVAGSIGPLDKSSVDQQLSDQQVYDIYKEQVLALAGGGIDVFMLETFSNLEHIRIALSACKNETTLPVIAQMVFLDGLRTGYGSSIQAVVEALTAGGADVIGANCGSGPAALKDVIDRLARITEKYISALPNAGYPQTVDGRSMYLTSPEYFAVHAQELTAGGANIIGGCCGTTPEHIRLIAGRLKNRKPAPRPAGKTQTETAFIQSPAFYEKKGVGAANVIVELLPPRDADIEKLIDVAAMLKGSGAQVLSFPENPLAQVRMSSIAAAGLIKRTIGIETIFHYTCRDRNLIGLQSDLLGAYALGLRYMLAVTGDAVSLGNNPEASPVYDVDSIKLVNLIDNMKKSLHLDMRVGVAFNPNLADISSQVKRLRRKIEAGAEFVMTQPMFDAGKALSMCEAVKDLNIPVYLGILPLVSKRNAEYLHNEVPGISIPDDVRARMDIEDKAKARVEGISIALEIMRATKNAVNGFYLISPLHRYEMSAAIIKEI
ncbi:MAG: bifunctional homocysteine S-methyltransferase/methylenetetrahydrofolate reductase [Dehalococcoidia bacterium]|nr:bifunctional homocysteine S-methyltransferase/methylenetetrahydrofolate reductase [Dehalococcoidia bacterium]